MRRRPSLKQIAQSAALHEETAKMSVFSKMKNPQPVAIAWVADLSGG
jgi:hypothetical protein